jgi:hypothetical protein
MTLEVLENILQFLLIECCLFSAGLKVDYWLCGVTIDIILAVFCFGFMDTPLLQERPKLVLQLLAGRIFQKLKSTSL